MVNQFHKALAHHYTIGGKHLYDPTDMEQFCDNHAPGLFKQVYTAILNDSKKVPSVKRVELQKVRTVAILHNLCFFCNQVFFLEINNYYKIHVFYYWYINYDYTCPIYFNFLMFFFFNSYKYLYMQHALVQKLYPPIWTGKEMSSLGSR